MHALSYLFAQAKALYAKEPARAISAVAGAIVFLAADAGIVLPDQSVIAALGFALPLIFGGEAIRSRVSPSK